MDRTHKYLEMLRSPKSSKRYEACEDLRIGEESSPEVVNALEELTSDPNPEVAYAAVRALNGEAQAAVLMILGKRPPELGGQTP